MAAQAPSRYDSDVPDTLDLAERARVGVNALVGVLDRTRRFQPHQCMRHYRSPPVLSPEPGGSIFACGNEMWGKHAEALLEMRLMSGSELEPGIDEESLRGMVSCIEEDGLFYSYIKKVDGEHLVDAEDFSDLLGGARVILALLAKAEVDVDPTWIDQAARLVRGFEKHAVHRGEYAYYPDGHAGGAVSRPRSGWRSTAEPAGASLAQSREWYECASNVLFSHGGIVQALCRWHQAAGDAEALALAGKVARFMLHERFWRREAGPAAVVGAEHAHFEGHIHATARGLWGLLEYAALAGDERIMGFVRDGYEYIRSFGISRIGLFGEGCTVGDMTSLAVRMSDLGVGDYWEDVDQYVRNHLTELQVLDPAPIQAIAAASPAAAVRAWEDAEGFVERTMGALCDDALHPTLSTPGLMLCCTYNGLIGYYHAWEAIVRSSSAHAEVNLLLNRASPWLDMESYLPYEGKVVIRNKAARSVSVRFPRWVSLAAVAGAINGRRASPLRLGRCLLYQGLGPTDVITLEFPVVESGAAYTVGWSGIHVPGWTEVTRLLAAEKPSGPLEYQVSSAQRDGVTEPGPVYTFRFRGNDVVDVGPRETGLGYPLYRRGPLTGRAPIHRVSRSVAQSVLRI